MFRPVLCHILNQFFFVPHELFNGFQEHAPKSIESKDTKFSPVVPVLRIALLHYIESAMQSRTKKNCKCRKRRQIE